MFWALFYTKCFAELSMHLPGRLFKIFILYLMGQKLRERNKCTELGRGTHPIQTQGVFLFFNSILQSYCLFHHNFKTWRNLQVAEKTQMGPGTEESVFGTIIESILLGCFLSKHCLNIFYINKDGTICKGNCQEIPVLYFLPELIGVVVFHTPVWSITEEPE